MGSAEIGVARLLFERLRDGGVEAMLASVHPDFEVTTPARLASEPGTYRGHDGVRRWFSSFLEAMEEVRLEPSEFVDLGRSRVAVEFEIVARGRATDLEVRQGVGAICRLRDAKLVSMELFTSLEEALASE